MRYPNEEVNCTEPSPSVSVPCFGLPAYACVKNDALPCCQLAISLTVLSITEKYKPDVTELLLF